MKTLARGLVIIGCLYPVCRLIIGIVIFEPEGRNFR